MALHLSKALFNHSSSLILSALLLTLATSCACNDPAKPEIKKNSNEDKFTRTRQNQVADLENIKIANQLDHEITEAQAIISSINDSAIQGIVKFIKTDEGIRIIADVDGLKPGQHGFHIHEFGDCHGKNYDSVGAHYNPTGKQHGKPDNHESHMGDLGNLLADENGHAHYEAINKAIKLQGRYSILGRSVIIHSDKDDYVSQPAGASGTKIACGVIEPSSGL